MKSLQRCLGRGAGYTGRSKLPHALRSKMAVYDAYKAIDSFNSPHPWDRFSRPLRIRSGSPYRLYDVISRSLSSNPHKDLR